MPANERLSRLLGVAIVALLVLNGHGLWRLLASRSDANTAGTSLESCERLAGEIIELHQQPTLAAIGTSSDLASAMATAIEAAGADAAVVRSIDPQPASRIAGTSYERQSTVVSLESVDMAALVATLQQLVSTSVGLHVTEIDLEPASRAIGPDERWDASLKLTKLIYVP